MDKIQHILYINLERRKDRKESVESELKKVGFTNFKRFNAFDIKENPRLGCSTSHLNCLQYAKEQNWDMVMIVEDDIIFENVELFQKQLELFMNSDINWDVVLLAGNNCEPYEKVSPFALKINNCQTTTGYIVKSHYYDYLIDNIKDGCKRCYQTRGADENTIDMEWKVLQNIDNWFLLWPPYVFQKDDYSDIERRRVNYRLMMKNPNNFFRLNPRQILQYKLFMKQKSIPILKKRKEKK